MRKWILVFTLGLVLGGCAGDPDSQLSEREYRRKELQMEREEENEPPRR